MTKADTAQAGGTSSSVRLNAATGPNADVTGHISRLTDGVVVAQARLYPVGAPIWLENSGLRPCSSA